MRKKKKFTIFVGLYDLDQGNFFDFNSTYICTIINFPNSINSLDNSAGTYCIGYLNENAFILVNKSTFLDNLSLNSGIFYIYNL